MRTFYGTRLSDNMAKTPEGYLICYDVHIARIGKQDYLGSELGVDDDVVAVDRPANEVFNPATVASFEGKPFTNDHPYELLDVNNTPIYEKGHVQNVRISDDRVYLDADIMVKDAQTIQEIENGKRELSAGYNCDCLQDENGNWYQANIIGNHVALVDKGRAGEQVRINDAEWNEADHPCAKNGQFSKGSGGSTASSQEKSESGEKSKGSEGIKSKITSENDLNQKYGISKYDLHEKSVRNNDTEKSANEHGFEYDSRAEGSYVKENGDNTFFVAEFKGIRGERVFACSAWNEKTGDAGFQQTFIEADTPEDAMNYMENEFIPNYTKENKEKKTMKDSKSVLGKLLKAFAKDAEPEEMVEALEAVKGKDEEPDRLGKLEMMVQDLCKRMDAYDEAHKPEEEPEMTALDGVEKEVLADEEPEKKEVEDEDANNDPKLIEAVDEKAQEDEDTTEEIKKEIADAKKVVARIEDKEVRLAVADSLATIIRGKIKSSANYKKLMDASKQNSNPAPSNSINYSEVYSKIKEERFRK